MYKYLKLLAFSALALSLTACLEVEDNDNDQDLVNALETQNEILQEQAESNAPASVTLFGKLENLSTGQSVGEATITIKVGNTSWGEPATVTDGGFEITGLPANSDFELLVHSPANSFMDRVVFGSTSQASSGVVYQDIGIIEVSEAEEVIFTVQNFDTAEPVPNLSFIGYSHLGSGSSYRNHAHSSSYNAETGMYTLTVPIDLDVTFTATLDVDNDGIYEWSAYSDFIRGTLSFNTDSIGDENLFVVYPGEASEPSELEVRISVLDENLDSLSDGLTVAINDSLNGNLTATFDGETNQYILDAKVRKELQILIPAFSVGDTDYGSTSVVIDLSQQYFNVDIVGTGIYFPAYSVPNTVEVLDVAVRPPVQTLNSSLAIVNRTSEIHAPSYAYKAFFSNAIELMDDSLGLFEIGAVSVIEGNASNSDLVLPGTTLILEDDLQVDLTHTLTLNNTFLAATPTDAIKPGTRYRYMMGDVIDSLTGTENAFSHYVDFTTAPAPATFDINDVALDNNNFTNNGAAITPANTAGIASSPSDSNRSVFLVFPSSIENLNSLAINKQLVIEDGMASNPVRSFEVVENGVPVISKTYLVSTAENESRQLVDNSSGNYVTFMSGMSQGNGYRYTLSVGEYMSDDTDANENTITFEYVYETADGTVANGEITLAVQ